jgi:hypothetical protein
MELDPVFLSRLQFAFVISFHIIFPVAAKPRAPETRAPASRLWPTCGARSVRRFSRIGLLAISGVCCCRDENHDAQATQVSQADQIAKETS